MQKRKNALEMLGWFFHQSSRRGRASSCRECAAAARAAAKHFIEEVQQKLEGVAARLDNPAQASSQALRVPTGQPPNMFSPATWTAAFTEFFWDGTPRLARQTPLLFEDWASCLQEREQLEYHLDEDAHVQHCRQTGSLDQTC